MDVVPRVRLRGPRAAILGLVLALALALASVAVWVVVGRSDDAPSARDPLLWPFGPESIWNHPLGDDSDRVPLPVAPPLDRTLAAEEDLLFISPDNPPQPILEHDAGWTGASRCDARTGRVLVPEVPVPTGWETDPGYVGDVPNHSAAIVMGDGTLLETQPLHVCPDGAVVSQYAPETWRGTSVRAGAETVVPGSHGGSGLTAFGGTIRLGEWVPGEEIIPHVLKIELHAADHLSRFEDGYRWPADRADDALSRYGGKEEEARMGSLLALPESFEVDELSSEAAQILARTLMGYGAYVVDDTNRSTVAFATEWGPQGRVLDEFADEWGHDLAGRIDEAEGEQQRFLEDMLEIYAELEVVADNAPDNVGGAGDRLAPWAPPLLPECPDSASQQKGC